MTLSPAVRAKLRSVGIDPDPTTLRAELERRTAAQADRRAHFERIVRDYPLACSVLWRANAASCDQRRAVVAAMRAPVVALVLGGERSGKSKGLKELTLAMALGGDHPLVRAWVALNELPYTIPDGPAQVYAVALTSNDSRRYHRPDLKELVGAMPHKWHNFGGDGESRVEIRVPGYSKPAIIHFKSIDQGSKSFQGISLRWVWIDEEPEGSEGRAVYAQCRARVMDQDGRIGISMVPRLGFTWVYDDLIRDGRDQAIHVELDPLDNPHLPKARAQSHFDSMTEDEQSVHRYGRFTARAGAIYPTFKVGDAERYGMGHVCHPFAIPKDWPRFRSADFGLDNPTAVVWGTLGDDNTLYIYREYYKAKGLSYPWHADRVLAVECGQTLKGDEIEGIACEQEPIEAGWGDPASREGRDAFNAVGLETWPAENDVQLGYDRVRDRLRLRADNRPRIKFFTTCPVSIKEIGGLVRNHKMIEVVQMKKDDHAADAIRYLCCGVYSWLGL